MSEARVSAKVALVHGSGFEVVDGLQMLSAASRANADQAARLWADGQVEQLLLSGRGPLDGHTYRFSEARMMASRLRGWGVSSRRIEIEETSTSTVGNWAHSAPIIQGLGAESVLGVMAKPSIPRASRIGEFVAAQHDFELIGYVPSAMPTHLTDRARELVMNQLTRRFLATHADIPVEDLDAAYDAYKQSLGLNAVKRIVHRSSVIA